MEEILGGIEQIIIYIDDILVYAHDVAELKEITKKVLLKLEENNLTLNSEKCEYEVDKLDFLGHELTADGFNISKKKVEDEMKFRSPSSSSELKSFLGLASFLGSYIKDFAGMTKLLWDASSAENFEWNEERERAFEELRGAIAQSTVKQGFFNGTQSETHPWRS